ncbi:MAG: hypothetical protein ACKV2U_29625 [Bryobacteraceae bacterium]
MTSAREIERLMEYEPGLMWLAGLGKVNHHTLSDFRAGHEAALKELLFGVLSYDIMQWVRLSWMPKCALPAMGATV